MARYVWPAGLPSPSPSSAFSRAGLPLQADRLGDKIAASRRKGIWVGGNIPLGYCLNGGKIVVVDNDAGLVRDIYRRYLEVGSLNFLMADLRERQIVTRIKRLKSVGASAAYAALIPA
jgi:hypothetical protein